MKEFKEITDPKVKRMWFEELKDLRQRAEDLLETHFLTGQALCKMQIIRTRTADEWSVMIRSGTKPVVSTN